MLDSWPRMRVATINVLASCQGGRADRAFLERSEGLSLSLETSVSTPKLWPSSTETLPILCRRDEAKQDREARMEVAYMQGRRCFAFTLPPRRPVGVASIRSMGRRVWKDSSSAWSQANSRGSVVGRWADLEQERTAETNQNARDENCQK